MAKTSPVEFMQQVGAETAKVSWPTRRETIITTIMVMVFAVLAAIFFSVADYVLQQLVTLVLGFGQ